MSENKEEKCDCSFCKLRKISNENTLEQLKWYQEQKDKIVKSNQERNMELIELCIKDKYN